MPDASDSTSKVMPPMSPLRPEGKPPGKKKKGNSPDQKEQSKDKDSPGHDTNRGRAVDVRI